MKLEGKVAVITGCARGIGEATVRLFASEGAKLMINDISDEIANLSKELVNQGCDVRYSIGDVSDSDSVNKMVDETINCFGRIDILVNTVALPHRKDIMETSEEEFGHIINTNMKAVFLPCKIVIPHMISRNYGRIINLSSVAGIRGGGLLGKSTYAGSKAGVIGLSKGIAREVAKYGITCNVVCPGFTKTPRNNLETQENINRILAMTPLGRGGEAIDIAPTILHLASDDARFTTGTVSVIDGGITMV